MALNLDPEFVRHIQGIYGDADLDGRTIKQLYQTWQTNPQFIRNAYNQKNQPKTVSQTKPQLAPKAQLNPGQINKPEVANDDLSGITNFSDAFRVANQKRLGQFKWKGTKANPSGLFGAQMATQNTQVKQTPSVKQTTTKTTEQPITKQAEPNRTPDKLNSFMSKANSSFIGQAPFPPTSVLFGKLTSKSQTVQNNNTPDKNLTMRISPVQKINNNSNLKRDVPKSKVDANYGNTQPDYNTYRNYIIQNDITPTPEQSQYKWDWAVRGASFRPNMFQQGGAMQQPSQDEEMKKAFIQFLVQDAAAQGVQIQSEQDLQNYAQQLGQEGLQAKYQEFMQRMQGGVKAKLGSKLTYLKKLKRNK